MMIGKMMEMLSTPTDRESSSDDRADEGQCGLGPSPAETALERDATRTTHVADLVVPQAAPSPPDTSNPLGENTTGPTPGSESSPDNTYDMQGGGDGVPSMAPDGVDLDGMTGFSMDNMDLPDFPELGILPLETTAYGWDQLRQQLFPVHPNLDFGMPLAPPSDQNWRLPRGEGNLSSEESGDEEEEDVVNQVSERVGSLHLSEDGELRYYGATSNLTLLDDTSPLDHRHDLEAGNVRKRGQAMMEAAGVGQHVNPALVQHLSSLYFAWQDPSFHVVDKDMYEREQARFLSSEDSTFYSETLTNTMQAALGAGSPYAMER